MTQFPTHDLIYLSFTNWTGLRVAEYGSFSFLELFCINFTSSIYIRTFLDLIVIYHIFTGQLISVVVVNIHSFPVIY